MRQVSSLRGLPGRAKVGTSIAVAAAMLGQLVLGTIASAAAIPSNKVGISMTGFKLSGAFSQSGSQQSGAGSFGNGNITNYPEGACVPVRVLVKNNDNAAGDTVVSPIFDYLNPDLGAERLEIVGTSLSGASLAGSGADNLNDFTTPGTELTAATSFSTKENGSVSATVTGPYSGNNSGTTATTISDTFRHYNVSLSNIPAGGTVNLVFCARLGVDASEYNGSSLSVRTAQGGNENVPISTSQLLVLPKLTITKTVVGGSATPDQFSFTVSPSINNQSVFPMEADGTIVIDNVPVSGAYTITESSLANYSLTSVSGTNCVASGNGASATLASGNPATDATCTFVNTYQAPPPEPTTATLTVIKTVVGGELSASAFTLNVTGGNASPASFSGDADGTAVTVDIDGEYAVSETAVENYTASYSEACSGTMTSEGATCTVTNTYQAPPPPEPTTGTVTVTKVVVGGELSASSFPLFVGEESVDSGVAEDFAAGSYVVSETNQPNYTAAFSGDCAQGNLTVVAGESYACTITNTYQAPPPQETEQNIKVSLVVINDDGGSATPADFSATVDGNGVAFDAATYLNVGNHTVVVSGPSGYSISYSGDCDSSGIVDLAASSSETCTATANDIAQEEPETPPTPPGGGGGSIPTGTIVIITNVINDNGGSKTASQFNMTVTNGAVTSMVSGSETGNSINFQPGSYTADGSTDAAYSKTLSAACSGTLAANTTVTCTVTYDDVGSGSAPTPPAPPAPPAPEPQVLGATDEEPAAPVPQVLGATDTQLPVTGMPTGALLALALGAIPFTIRRKK